MRFWRYLLNLSKVRHLENRPHFGIILRISFANKQGLTVLFEDDPPLFNQYGSILVNPKRHLHVNALAGQKFIDWMIGKEGQSAIASFRRGGHQLFFPNATP